MTKEDKRVESPGKTLAVGAGVGAAVGAATTAAVVPAVQAAGFTAAGIAAESAAAGMMSAAATAGGGGIAAGSTVAVLQSIGATAAVPLGIASIVERSPRKGNFSDAADQYPLVRRRSPSTYKHRI